MRSSEIKRETQFMTFLIKHSWWKFWNQGSITWTFLDYLFKNIKVEKIHHITTPAEYAANDMTAHSLWLS